MTSTRETSQEIDPREAEGTADRATRQRPEPYRTGRLGGLLRAEAHRFVVRRFIRWLFVLAAVGYAVVVPLIAWTQFARTTPELLAQARAEIDEIVAEDVAYRQECLQQPLPPDVPDEVTPEEFCEPAFEASDFVVEEYLPKIPFDLASALEPGAVAVGIAVAAMFFVIGATWIGAEWSARTMTALLFWETRRLRVLTVKAAVLAAAAALSAVVAQGAWVGSAWAIASTRGSTGPLPSGFWADAVALGGRVTLLAVLVALLGFAVAQLARSTGAALGVGFVYFAVVETAVQLAVPNWTPWLLGVSSAGLVLKGGATVVVPGTGVDETGQIVAFTERTVSNLQGGLVIGGTVFVLLLLGAWLFRRRDLT